ncbi:glycoprotein-N-acetylgalactosamine 3-beta-galactosyltransferase 1-B-like isoform X2 [Plodia interpunctella]|nr:glycoprotein-N-acetylgalactosamine 3-beta-galactosyltransferase 1-B-like isoform X2 [Plodia interpunctella]
MGLGATVAMDPPAIAISDTWGKRCNHILFMNEPDTISLKPPLGKDQHHLLYMYSKVGFIDWFLLTMSSECYVVIENLRYLLADYDPNDAIFFMLTVREKANITYVLSQKAVELFLKTALDTTACNTSKNDIVARMNCFRSIGIKRKDEQDYLQRDLFLSGNVYRRNTSGNFWNCRNLPEKPRDCYSDFAISMDGVDSKMKYVLDYFLYTLKPYGIKFGGKMPAILGENRQFQYGDYPTNIRSLAGEKKSQEKYRHKWNSMEEDYPQDDSISSEDSK